MKAYLKARKQQEKCLAIGLLMAAGAVMLDCGYDGPYEMVTETYVVKSGDTLDEIAYKFYDKNETRRYFLEFREGIYEENYWVRKEGLHPGDELKINYWVKKENDSNEQRNNL